MRIGLMSGTSAAAGNGLKDLVAFAQDAEKRGFDSIWLANIFGMDAVGACAIAGWETSRIEFGTAVTPTYPALQARPPEPLSPSLVPLSFLGPPVI